MFAAQTLTRWTHTACGRALHTLPQLCVVCRDWTQGALCAPCRSRFAPQRQRCLRCAAAVPSAVLTCGRCLTAPLAMSACVAAVDYVSPWDGLLSRFKFNAEAGLAHALAPLMVSALQEHTAVAPDWVLPVPLSTRRLRERGYNQAALLARLIARSLQLRLTHDLVRRHQDTAHQLGLHAQERQRNVKGAFSVNPARQNQLQGRHIALVDDVMTTGATADEIARTLLTAGAASVTLWVAARTV